MFTNKKDDLKNKTPEEEQSQPECPRCRRKGHTITTCPSPKSPGEPPTP